MFLCFCVSGFERARVLVVSSVISATCALCVATNQQSNLVAHKPAEIRNTVKQTNQQTLSAPPKDQLRLPSNSFCLYRSRRCQCEERERERNVLRCSLEMFMIYCSAAKQAKEKRRAKLKIKTERIRSQTSCYHVCERDTQLARTVVAGKGLKSDFTAKGERQLANGEYRERRAEKAARQR